MVSVTQSWIGAEAPAQDFVVEGPIFPCSISLSSMAYFEVLPGPVETGVYRGGSDGCVVE
jgi:hypothetical protein